MQDFVRISNIYLAAYLLSCGKNLCGTKISNDIEDRVEFLFSKDHDINKLVNLFYKGVARVEPRGYSFIIKDLKATATREINAYKSEKSKNDKAEDN